MDTDLLGCIARIGIAAIGERICRETAAAVSASDARATDACGLAVTSRRVSSKCGVEGKRRERGKGWGTDTALRSHGGYSIWDCFVPTVAREKIGRIAVGLRTGDG